MIEHGQSVISVTTMLMLSLGMNLIVSTTFSKSPIKCTVLLFGMIFIVVGG